VGQQADLDLFSRAADRHPIQQKTGNRLLLKAHRMDEHLDRIALFLFSRQFHLRLPPEKLPDHAAFDPFARGNGLAKHLKNMKVAAEAGCDERQNRRKNNEGNEDLNEGKTDYGRLVLSQFPISSLVPSAPSGPTEKRS